MKLLIVLVTVLISTTGFTRSIDIDELSKIYGMAKGLYSIGNDGNWIGESLVQKNDYYKLIIGKTVQKLEKYDDINNSIKTCVFYPYGAYGDHLTIEEQERISDALSSYLDLAVLNKGIKIYKINEVVVDDFLFASDCVVAIKKAGNVLLMQGGTMD